MRPFNIQRVDVLPISYVRYTVYLLAAELTRCVAPITPKFGSRLYEHLHAGKLYYHVCAVYVELATYPKPGNLSAALNACTVKA